MSYNAKNYTEQGGEVTHIGGKLVFEEGGSIAGFPGAANQEPVTGNRKPGEGCEGCLQRSSHRAKKRRNHGSGQLECVCPGLSDASCHADQ